MTKDIDIELIKADFMLHWCGKVQALTELRRTKMSQQKMSDLTDGSIKTIQRFENYKREDAELMYLYKKILNAFSDV
jgi:Trp operon repressor